MINTLSAGKDNFYRQMLKLTIPIIIQNLLSAAVNSAAEICNSHNPKIRRTDRDQFLIRSKNLHHKLRSSKCDQCYDSRDYDGKAEGNSLDRMNSLHIIFSEILRTQKRCACTKSIIYHKQDIGVIGSQRHRRNRRLSHIIKHNYICGVNRCTEQILDNDRNRQFKHLPVKIILTGR